MVLTCGSSDSRTNNSVGSTDSVDAYACNSLDYPGPEYTYSFQPTVSESVTVNLTDLAADLDLFVLQGSGSGGQADDCIDSSTSSLTADDSVTFQAVAGMTYFIAVDGFEGAVSNYHISLSCPSTGACVHGCTALCLNDRRFMVEVDWRDFAGNTGSGQVVPVGSADSGLFYFFAPDNWEMLIKVLDGCSVTDHFWVFAAATTNVEYTLRVTDTQADVVMEYFNPLGNAAAAITDTSAFATCP